MAGPTYGPIYTEPDYVAHELYETAGYVLWVNIEQEGPSQALHFGLRIHTSIDDTLSRYHDQKFKVFLDRNTTTAMAQLQLLRDAMWSDKIGFPYLVHVHFNFASESESWAYVYWMTVLLTDTHPVTVHAFRGVRAEYGWYYHDEGGPEYP